MMGNQNQIKLVVFLGLVLFWAFAISNSFASDIPMIEGAYPKEELFLQGETSVVLKTLTYSGYGIDRVFAKIIPSDNLNHPLWPPHTFPIIRMFDEDNDGIYEGTYDDFSLIGIYRVCFHSIDKRGYMSLPVCTAITQTVALGQPSAPRIDSVYPSMAQMNEEIDVTIHGENFDTATNISMNSASIQNYLIIGSMDTPGYASDLKISGNVAFVADRFSGFQVIDFNDRFRPMILAFIDTVGSAHSITISDNKAFVADYSGGLQIIDISIPSDPYIIGFANETDLLTAVNCVEVSGNTAYVTDGKSGFLTIDVSDPSDPVISGSMDTPHQAKRLTVFNGRAFVTESYVINYEESGSLLIIDVSDAANPSIIGSVDTTGSAEDVAVVGDTVYVADGQDGLQIIDISDPFQPVIIGSVNTTGEAMQVTVVNNIAFVAAGTGGFQKIDVSDPANPFVVGIGDTYFARGIAVGGNHAFIADATSGLQIIDFQNQATSPPPASDPYEIEQFVIVDDTTIRATIPSPQTAGHYTLHVSNEDGNDELVDALTFLEQADYQSQFRKKAIIVAARAEDPFGEDILWENGFTQTNAICAYRSLMSRGYTHDTVLYLSPEEIDVDGDGINDVDLISTYDNLSYAFDTWVFDPAIFAHGLIVYLIGHGETGFFRINSAERVTEQEMADWLDTAENNLEQELIFIYDGCYSGSFYDSLATGSASQRIIMASAAEEEMAWFQAGGKTSFSYPFWDHISKGYRIGQAYERAKIIVSVFEQNPVIYNRTLADSLFIGLDKISAPIGPEIKSITPESQTLDGECYLAMKVSIYSANGIKSVKAIIIPPGSTQRTADGDVNILPEVTLTDGDEDGTYEGIYYGFTQIGTYTITISAEDKDGEQAYDPNRVITVIQNADLLPGDINGDGAVTIADIIMALRTVSEGALKGVQMKADLTGDDRIGMEDAIALLRKLSG